MANRYLYLTDSRLACLTLARGHVRDAREFETTEEGAAAFEAWLAAAPRLPDPRHHDLAEEDFRPDTIPHVGGGDRDAIVTRKLGQIFRNTPYRHALVQGRETEGRRDDRVVYAAITNPEVLKPWIERLERLEIPLAGVHSAAVLGTRLLEAVGVRHPHTLLVHFSPGGALRQTYFRAGEIRFTRLTPLDHEDDRTLGGIVADETTRTWQYLDNLRSFAAADRLEIYVLVHPQDRAAVEPALAGFEQVAYHLLDSHEVAAKVGLIQAPANSGTELILARLLDRHGIENHFATPEMRRHYTFARARNVMNALSIAILGVGIAAVVINLQGIFAANDEDQKAGRDIAALNREYDQVTRALPATGVGGAAMRDAVSFYTGYIQEYPSITRFLVPLSDVLQQHPRVRLSQLSWQATDDPAANPPLASQPPRVPPPVKSSGKGADVAARGAAPDDPMAPFGGGRYEVALVEATVSVPSHDFRAALGEVDRLASEIRAVKGFQAEVVESPLDVRTSLLLQGRHAEREAQGMEARFILRIVRKGLAT
jgi:type II secretory pathway pseudopilin PulG